LFSFLFRKTDFFYEMEKPGEKMGFPPGAQKKMLLEIFKMYQ
jgi:hypothetical protein